MDEISAIVTDNTSGECYITTAAPTYMQTISIHNGGKQLVEITPEGKAIYDPNDIDEATKIFWDCMALSFPIYQLKTENDKLQKEIAALKEENAHLQSLLAVDEQSVDFTIDPVAYAKLYPYQQQIVEQITEAFRIDREMLLPSEPNSQNELISFDELVAMPFSYDHPGAKIGDVWLDTGTGETYIFDGSVWVESNPNTATQPQPVIEDSTEKRKKAYDEAMKILGK